MTIKILTKEQIIKEMDLLDFEYQVYIPRNNECIDKWIPEWARGILIEADYSDLPEGTQLITKDGWRVGNGFISEANVLPSYPNSNGEFLYEITTDIGNKIIATPEEIEELYEIGYYVRKEGYFSTF